MSRQSATARPTKGPKRRRELLDAAAQVFFERSYADATVQNIADALGILKGSLYYYIDTKEDLLFWLLDEIHDAVDEVLAQAALRDEGLPALERLAAYIRDQVEWSLRNLVRITVYYHDVSGLGEERRSQIFERRKAHEEYVTGLIRDAQAEGAADQSLDPRILANCVFGTMIWTYRWYRPAAGSPAEVADLCARYALRGVAGDLGLDLDLDLDRPPAA